MSENTKLLRFAVLSDIHPTYLEDKFELGTSQLKIDGPLDSFVNPFSGLEALIKSEKLKIDYVLCAGDLGSKSHPATIDYTWKALNTFTATASAKKLIATPGNHDHDSRSKYIDYDPKGFLQSLSPIFPCDFGDLNSHFWAWGFDIQEGDNFRIIVLNSSAYHGINAEFEHGRVTETTCRRIKEKLQGLPDKPLNMLLCHHHLQKNEEIKIGLYDAMHGSERLLSTLNEEIGGEWIAIHGHKHYPRIYYGSSSSGEAPVIFSAGSFAGDISGDLGTVVSNQFYIIEFDLDVLSSNGLRGRFFAWDWAAGRGWRPASNRSGLPSAGGFGYKISVKKDLARIRDYFNDTRTRIEGQDLTEEFPELQYVTPAGLEKLKSAGAAQNAFEIFIEEGNVKEITRIKVQ